MVNSKRASAERKSPDYPKLMESETTIILFEKYGCGSVVSSSVHPVGHYSEDWAMSRFFDFDGSVTLSNGG